MRVQDLIEILQHLEPDKTIVIEGCNVIEIEDEGDFYGINFWYQSVPEQTHDVTTKCSD